MATEDPQNEESQRSSEESTGDPALDERLAQGVLDGLGGIDKAQVGISIFLIAVVGIIAFSNAVNLPYHLDDQRFIVENADLQRVETAYRAWDSQTLRPLAALSIAVNWSLGGGSAAGFHFVNILLHLLAGVCVYLICRRLLDRNTPEAVSMVSGMLFVAHPAVTQAVNYLPSRGILLGTLLLLVSVLFYLHGIESKSKWRHRFLCLSLLSFAMAWASDASAWILPLLLVPFAFATAKRNPLTEQVKIVAIYGLLLASLVTVQGIGGASSGPESLGFMSSVEQANVFAKFVSQTLLPLGLQVEHAPYTDSLLSIPWLWAGCVVAALVLFRFAPVPALALLWYLVAILGPGSFRSYAAFDEANLYLPLAGIVIIPAWALSVLKNPPLRLMTGLACALLIIAFIALTSTRNNQWRSDAIWIQANEACPHCPGPAEHRAHFHLAQGETAFFSLAQGQAGLNLDSLRREALEHFTLAQAFFGSASAKGSPSADVLTGLARTQNYLGDPGSAIGSLKSALRVDPMHEGAVLLLAQLNANRAETTGQYADLRSAVDYFRYADRLLDLSPETIGRYANLASRLGDLQGALALIASLDAEERERMPEQTLLDVTRKIQAMQTVQSAIEATVQNADPGPGLKVLRAQRLHIEGQYLASNYLLHEAARETELTSQMWILIGVNNAKMTSMEEFLVDWPDGPSGESDFDEWRMLAGACASAGEWESARAVFDYAAEGPGGGRTPLVLLAELAAGLNDAQRAATYYQQAIDADAGEVSAWLGMADLLLNQGQNDAAVYFITQAQQNGAPESAVNARKERAGMQDSDEHGIQRSIIR